MKHLPLISGALLTAALLTSHGVNAGPDKADLLDYLAQQIAANPDSATPYLRLSLIHI